MHSLVIFGCIFLVVIAILDRIPGVQYLIKPIFDLIIWLFTTFLGSVTAWFVWCVKTTWLSHVILIKHLFSGRADLDPTDAIVELNRRGGVAESE